MSFVRDFSDVTMSDLPQVGGKNASLGEMISHLAPKGIRIPSGFATSADAYCHFLQDNQLEQEIESLLSNLDPNNISQLKAVSARIKQLIGTGEFSKSFVEAIRQAYQRLQLDLQHTVAVRSSATAEDLPTAYFAGLYS